MKNYEKIAKFALDNMGKSFTVPLKYSNLTGNTTNITGKLVGFKFTEDWLVLEIKDKENKQASSRSEFLNVKWLCEVGTDANIYLKAGYIPGDEHKEKKEEETPTHSPFGREANPLEITKEDVKILEREPAPLHIQVPVTIEES